MYQYVVSAQKPTNVTHVLKGHFMSTSELNLIIVKSTRIEFHTLTPDGLLAQFDLGIYGRVATCKLYKPHGEQRELLFVATERRQYFVLSYDAKKKQIVTKAKGEITSRINRPNENGQIGIIDPDSRVIGLNLYQGQFDVIPMDSRGQLKDSFNIRLEEINVIDIQFLHGYNVPTICVLYEDNRNNRCTRHIKTYGISLKDMEFTEGPWSQPNVDLETNMIIPIPEPAGGVLILGLETIAYRNGRPSGRSGQAGTTIAIPVRCGLIRAYAPIDSDGSRWLLCDEWGGLHVLALQMDKSSSSSTSGSVSNAAATPTAGGVGGSSSSSSSSSSLSSSSSSSSAAVAMASPAVGQASNALGGGISGSSSSSASTSAGAAIGGGGSAVVVDITMEYLGETSIASSIAYLDNGFVFIGSSFGDSQLIRLCPEKNEENDSYIEEIQTLTNLGPIVDFCVVDLDRQGQCQVVTCSGAFKDGSLRVVRNGIGIDEQAAVDLPGIKGLWSLRDSYETMWDTYLVQTFTSETRILAIQDEELGELEVGGFDGETATLYCGNMKGNYIVQVTSKEIRLMKCGDMDKVHSSWTPEGGHSITVASGNPTQLMVSLNGGKVILFELDENAGKFNVQSTKIMEHEVACINISPLVDKNRMEDDSNTPEETTDVAAIGLWTDVSIRILAMPKLEEIHKEMLHLDTIPRSLLFATLEGHDHLLAGMGDGKLITFHFVRGSTKDQLLTGKKMVTLGSRPISLTKFVSRESTHIFAGTDRPTVIYSSGSKLLYSNVNQREVTSMVSFNSESFPDCLALASEEDLTIGTINEIQKLHIRSYPLGEQPRRICYHQDSHAFGVCTIRSAGGKSSPSSSQQPVSGGGDQMELDTQIPNRVSPPIPPSQKQQQQMDEDPYVATLETNYVRLIDDQTFDILDSFKLDEFETGCSIICCSFSDEVDHANNPATSTSNNPSQTTTTSSSSSSSTSANPAASSSSSSSSSTSNITGKSTKGRAASEKQYIVVGTAYAIEGEQEPTKGRILVFEISSTNDGDDAGARMNQGEASDRKDESRKLVLITEKQTRGAVYSLNGFNGKLLAGINSKVKLFSFVDNGPDQSELVSKCGHHEHILALYIQSRGDFIVVGDLMKSISLLMYRAVDDTIEELARDYNANWMSAVGICDDDTFIGSETHMNLFMVRKNASADTEEARHMLKVVGEFHLGEFVNRFHHGSLVMRNAGQQQQQPTDSESKNDTTSSSGTNATAGNSNSSNSSSNNSGNANANEIPESVREVLNTSAKPDMLFGTVNGVIGVIATLTQGQYQLLRRVQKAIADVVQGVGGLSHSEWRSFRNDRKDSPAHGFIDGDLVEAFLDLDDKDAQKVVDRVNGKVKIANDDDDIAAIIGTSNEVTGDSMSLNIDVESLTRFIEDLARVH